MITSFSNERIRHVAMLQKKAALREEEDVFVAEGLRLFEEVPVSRLSEAYFTEGAVEALKQRGHADVAAILSSGRAELVSDAVFEKMSGVQTPQGALAVVRRYAYDWPALFPEGKAPLLLLLEDIRDPGNLGSMLRTAEAAGAGGVILGGECADVYNPKVVRSSMGAIFRLPFMRIRELSYCFSTLHGRGVSIYAAALDGAGCFSEADLSGGCAFIIGNEGAGIRKETIDEADGSLFIPMAGKTESLNASVSAALFLYEAARQRGYEK